MPSRPASPAVGLVLHPTKPVDQSVDRIVSAAREHDVSVLVRDADRHRVPVEVDVVSDSQFVSGVDAVIALGGDGTMLGAMRLMIDRPVPVLGVNHGNLGFLVEVTPAQLPTGLARLAAGDFSIEQHSCLEVSLGEIEFEPRLGFNDIVLSRASRTQGTMSVDLRVNDVSYGYYRADAVVISTPTGSTAYNYAAGGPVISPSAEAMVITPVAPMSGISRAVVLGAPDRVSLTTDEATVGVAVDGVVGGEFAGGDRLTAVLRRNAAQVVRLSAEEHAIRSRVKLSLLDLPLRRDQLLELVPEELRRDDRRR